MYSIFVDLLQKKGVTVYQVCKATGIASATMSDWKNGKSVPKQAKLIKIADYFGVSLDYLLTGKEQEGRPTVTDDDIKVALWGGDQEVTDEMWQEVKAFAEMVALKHRYNKEKGNNDESRTD